MKLEDIGWNGFFAQRFAPHAADGVVPARVAREDRQHYLVYCEQGDFLAEPSGQLRHRAASRADLPAVGDWAALTLHPGGGRGTIHALLPRQSQFVRKVAGETTEEQVLAANVTTVFLVTGLDGNFNVRRIERYLTLAWESGAVPVVVLNKADLCRDPGVQVQQAEEVAVGASVVAVSAIEGIGLDSLRGYAAPGETVAFLGSSGVGKSTLINALLGDERLRVQAVRAADSHGRHTTTTRQLIPLPGGGVLIDTPGMRELQLWGDADSLAHSFADIEELARSCRFADCRHRSEPGCAVRGAVERGALDSARLESYFRLERELAFLAVRQDQRARRREQREKGRQMSRWMTEYMRVVKKRRG